MISLFILDDASWWTGLGTALKFGSILIVVAGGISLFVYSRILYFAVFWLLALIPQILILSVDSPTSRLCMEFGHIKPCTAWPIIWLTIAMVEITLAWVPVLGRIARAVHNEAKLRET